MGIDAAAASPVPDRCRVLNHSYTCRIPIAACLLIRAKERSPLKLQREAYATGRQKAVDFVAGMFGWHVLNVVLIVAGFALAANAPSQLSSAAGVGFALLGCLALVGNLAGLVYFGLTRHWIVFGFLAGILAEVAPCLSLVWWLTASNFSLV